MPWAVYAYRLERRSSDPLCKGVSVVFLCVNRVQLLAPPEMTKQSEFWMGPPTEIRFHDGTEANPTYGLITQDGQIFSSTRS